MTEKENKVKQEELNVLEAEAKFRAAKSSLSFGEIKARAELDITLKKLREDVEGANLDVQRARAWLAKAQADLEKPFTNNDN